MGELGVASEADARQRRRYASALLEDLQALDRLCREGWIEDGPRRMGAEQEMFLVDHRGRPAPLAMQALEHLSDPGFTTELGLFNLEYNIPPQVLGGTCFRSLEVALDDMLSRARAALAALDGGVVLCGILPSLTVTDLSLDWMTPLPRYRELNRMVMGLTGGRIRTHIIGSDELQITHDNVLLEACNTSFQIHLQVGVEEFASVYNLAQVVTAPVLAAAANAPLLLQQRLWHETRIALFQQSLDLRSVENRLRNSWQRVAFGDRWVERSGVEVFRDQIARHRTLISGTVEESALERLERGEVPRLRALTLHNGTVYRWNRVCYGILDGRPHLRIEHRSLPSGPTVLDEVANAALFYGIMLGLREVYPDVRRAFRFDDVKTNFIAAARYGLKAQLRWANRELVSAQALLLAYLIPVAREGLLSVGVPADDVARYLGVMEERVASARTGAQWQLDAYDALAPAGTRAIRTQAITMGMMARQWEGVPVHRWTLPAPPTREAFPDLCVTVGQVMTPRLFTVSPEDPIELAANLMLWERIHHVPVEDDRGTLVGMVTCGALLRALVDMADDHDDPVPVEAVMVREPPTTTPATPCHDAIRVMLAHGTDSLSVVHQGRLVGLVSDHDFIYALARSLRPD